ncbi:MAG: Hsp20/alpha crystallin family protein [Peptococcaceae bacterium]|nr:Hsp20/alpha crystallin family protein [Peptococcaceae bacterium]
MYIEQATQGNQSHSYPLMSGWPYFTSAMPNPWLIHGAAGTIIPRMDILETDSSIIYVYDLAGADGSQLNLEVSSSEVALTAPLAASSKHANAVYVYQERPRGSYCRVVMPPAGVNLDEIKADYHNGVLEITFPKLKPKSQ